MKTYAGVGARNTPTKTLCLMNIIGIYLAYDGYTLNTGAAKGADQSFASGAIRAGGKVNLFLPWDNYETSWIETLMENKPKDSVLNVSVFNRNTDVDAIRSVYKLHPIGNNLNNSVAALHARNYLVLENSSFVVCYTKDGKEVGGTGQAIRIAKDTNKQIFNLGNKQDLQRILKSLITKIL